MQNTNRIINISIHQSERRRRSAQWVQYAHAHKETGGVGSRGIDKV